MTDSKRYEEMGRVVEEYQSAKKSLVCLESKVREYRRQIERALNCLSTDTLDINRVGNDLKLICNEGEVSYPSKNELAQVLLNIKNMKLELSNLERKKKSLGLE
ncbi:MAG: hypothetical protein OXM87_11845 [Truepera sp.]|nr:hypothetical protein [Truepera sp.]